MPIRHSKSSPAEPEDVSARYDIAQRLYIHGMVAWCEREYRRIVDSDPPESREVLRSRTVLAEIFHDQGRDTEAAAMLQKLVDQLHRNGELAQKMVGEYEMRPARSALNCTTIKPAKPTPNTMSTRKPTNWTKRSTRATRPIPIPTC